MHTGNGASSELWNSSKTVTHIAHHRTPPHAVGFQRRVQLRRARHTYVLLVKTTTRSDAAAENVCDVRYGPSQQEATTTVMPSYIRRRSKGVLSAISDERRASLAPPLPAPHECGRGDTTEVFFYRWVRIHKYRVWGTCSPQMWLQYCHCPSENKVLLCRI